VKKDEDEPESIQIARSTLKVRDNGDPNLIIDENNSLAIGMFTNMAYEESTSGIKSYKYKKEGYYEHPHDVYRYFVMHTQKHLLYLNKRSGIKEVAL
jgi:hypothetical protein